MALTGSPRESLPATTRQYSVFRSQSLILIFRIGTSMLPSLQARPFWTSAYIDSCNASTPAQPIRQNTGWT